jgi:hypothetical protein
MHIRMDLMNKISSRSGKKNDREVVNLFGDVGFLRCTVTLMDENRVVFCRPASPLYCLLILHYRPEGNMDGGFYPPPRP